MPLYRFLEWYPRYRQAFSEPVYEELYQFLSFPERIWSMAQASEVGKPALNGVVKELEEKFEGHLDFDNPVNRRMIGSMIKEILYDFGFRRKGQRMVSNSRYFTTASFYEFDQAKVQKEVAALFKVSEKGDEAVKTNSSEEALSEETSSYNALFNAQKKHEPEEELEELTRIIEDNNCSVDEKRHAMEKLGSIGKAVLHGIPAIRKALDDQVMAKTAVDTLTQIARSAYKYNNIPGIISEFTWMLRSYDANKRCMAAEALGEIGAPGATEAATALAETLRDEDAGVREAAAWALYNIGHPAFKTASPALAEALEDEDEEVRIASARALGVCAPISVKLLVELLEHENSCVSRMAAFELGRAGEYARVDAAEGLIKSLNSEDVELRAASAWALGGIVETTDDALEALSHTLKDNNDNIREKSVWALGRIGAKLNHFDNTLLLDALEDENKNVRKAAAWAMGNIERKKHKYEPTSRLMKLFQDESNHVQEKAAWALGMIGANCSSAKPAVPLLIEALYDEDWAIRKVASQALGRIGPFATQALSTLAKVQKDREEKEIVRHMAGWAIEEISKYRAEV